MSFGKRQVVIDGTISGMGRGAGNTPTELIAQYLNSKWDYNYDMDTLLDIIDDYMDNIKTKCSWGYTTPYFIAGCYGAHVNNIAYLTQKSSIRSTSIRYILHEVGPIARKRYDYDLLEKTYLDYLCNNVSYDLGYNDLKENLNDRKILILAPGSTVTKEFNKIKNYIKKNNPITISIGFIPDNLSVDYIFVSNTRRYTHLKDNENFINKKRIITSNIKHEKNSADEYILSFTNLIVPGNEHIDNSTLLLLHLLDSIAVSEIGIAGFDGYSYEPNNYANTDLELSNVLVSPDDTNLKIKEMLKKYLECRKNSCELKFITTSKFSSVLSSKE